MESRGKINIPCVVTALSNMSSTLSTWGDLFCWRLLAKEPLCLHTKRAHSSWVPGYKLTQTWLIQTSNNYHCFKKKKKSSSSCIGKMWKYGEKEKGERGALQFVQEQMHGYKAERQTTWNNCKTSWHVSYFPVPQYWQKKSLWQGLQMSTIPRKQLYLGKSFTSCLHWPRTWKNSNSHIALFDIVFTSQSQCRSSSLSKTKPLHRLVNTTADKHFCFPSPNMRTVSSGANNLPLPLFPTTLFSLPWKGICNPTGFNEV